MRRLISSILGLGLVAAVQAAEPPTLTVYTYSSFTAEWGPGPAIEQAFEAQCQCNLQFVALDDGVALLSRVKLEGKASKADVVLGLDTNLLAEAANSGLFAPHGLELTGLSLPIAWSDPLFVPFDYGWFAFVYDREALPNPPRSLKELVYASDARLLIEDPRTSTPGLGLLLWMRQVFGDQTAAAWSKLKPRIVTVSPGWSEAYGLFLKGEAPLVLSYTTSPAYHIINDKTERYAAAAFSEGHYLQVEVAAKLAAARQPELADQFLRFIISEGFQSQIPTGNWMYPVITLKNGLPPAFAALPQPERSLLFPADDLMQQRKTWVNEWLQALGR
ncbi:MAG TPA: thiamine ABC transporter substrate binding subunit [Candidatus Competibacteraceae bacterium]|nr:thiamine ABC transporter substrate binding subunit [Candidatus Competibacteraceae bacterium]